MEIRKIFETEAFINNHGVEARKFYQNEHMMMVHLNLKPGDTIAKHGAPLNVCFLVLEGKGIVEIGDESKEVDANTLIESPANCGHGWRNESDEVLRILVMKMQASTKK
ncbi:MAG: cupin domain-containing protein [Labilibaculum sp.]|nr:cupin domain-containing protein [Labilibaculum sp.]MBI9057767.1 cupin domain-containing protein [Labilibaculum sp.]